MPQPATTAVQDAPAPIARHRRGTAVQPRGRARITEIIEATTELFLEHGESAITIRNVANKLGLSPGNVTYYFKSGEDLFRSMFDHVNNQYLNKSASIIDREDLTADERFIMWVEWLIDTARSSDAQRFHYQLWSLSLAHDYVQEKRDTFYRDYWRLARDVIKQVNPQASRNAIADLASELCVTVEGLFVMFGNKREGVRPAMLRNFPHRMLSSIKAS